MRALALISCVVLPASYVACSSDGSAPNQGASGSAASDAGAESDPGSGGNPSGAGNASGGGTDNRAGAEQAGAPGLPGQGGDTGTGGSADPGAGGDSQLPGEGGSGGDAGVEPLECATDCSELTMGCQIGQCNTGTGSCETADAGDAAACDDRNPCTGNTTCSAGECAGSTLACDLPTGIGVSPGGSANLIGYHTGDFSDTCGAGQVLVGFHGSYTTSTSGTLTYVAGIQGICADVALEWSIEAEAYLAVTDQTAPLTFRGSDLFADFDRICPTGEVVVGLNGSGYGGGAITRFFVHCAPLRVVWNTGWEVELGVAHALPSPFLSLQVDTYTGLCPAGQVAIGAYGGYNSQFVQDITGGIGVICGASAATWP